MDIVKDVSSGDARKFLVSLDDGLRVECVALFHKRTLTACISSQVGCPVGCSFCATGRMGFRRNLCADEIVGQIGLMESVLDQKFTNVVFMGMGEPLLNYGNVVDAVKRINGSGLTWKRITVSTVGIPDRVACLGEDCKCRLAVSLHAPDDVLRSSLVPLGFSLRDIIDACRDFPSTKHNPIMFEYVLLGGVNDSLSHAKRLDSLLSSLSFVMVNLIPYNAVSGLGFSSPDQEKVRAFKDALSVKTIIRTPKGVEDSAACGMLEAKDDQSAQ